MRTILISWGGCLLLLTLGGTLMQTTDPRLLNPSQVQEAAATSNSSGGAFILGQFRSNLAEYLWMKNEEYFHRGITKGIEVIAGIEKSNCPSELHSQSHETDHEADEHHHDHEGEQDADEHNGNAQTDEHSQPSDWRGIIGVLHRQVQPWSVTHLHHSSVEEVLPWIRLTTWADPHQVEAFINGGYIMSAHLKKPEEAEAFLRNGVRLNPTDIRMRAAFGEFLLYEKQNPRAAYPVFCEARALGQGLKAPTEDASVARLNSYRALVLIFRHYGNHQMESKMVQEGLKFHPHDPVLLRSAHRQAFPEPPAEE